MQTLGNAITPPEVVSVLNNPARIKDAVDWFNQQIQLLHSQKVSTCARHNQRQPVSTLPIEILSSIFKYCIIHQMYKDDDDEMGEDGSDTYMPAVLNFAQVCNTWRQVVLSDRSLWSYVDVKSPALVEQMILRAKEYPLSITVNDDSYIRSILSGKFWPEPQWRQALELVSQKSSIIRSLCVSTLDLDLTPVFTSIVELPSLEWLKVRESDSSCRDIPYSLSSLSPHIIAPRLKYLCLKNMIYPLAEQPLKHLTALIIDNTQDEEAAGDSSIWSTPSFLLKILATTPALRKLSLCNALCFYDVPWVPELTVTMPMLEEFSLVAYTAPLLDFLGCLEMPKLTRLHIRSDGSCVESLPILEDDRLPPTLKRIVSHSSLSAALSPRCKLIIDNTPWYGDRAGRLQIKLKTLTESGSSMDPPIVDIDIIFDILDSSDDSPDSNDLSIYTPLKLRLLSSLAQSLPFELIETIHGLKIPLALRLFELPFPSLSTLVLSHSSTESFLGALREYAADNKTFHCLSTIVFQEKRWHSLDLSNDSSSPNSLTQLLVRHIEMGMPLKLLVLRQTGRSRMKYLPREGLGAIKRGLGTYGVRVKEK